jgi:hypothetical protein
MHEMTLTVHFTPQSLVRVGLGPERAVYVPIQAAKKNGAACLHRHGEPVWGSNVAEVCTPRSNRFPGDVER